MLTVKIEGLDELKRKLDDVARRQVPFAASLAINKTAQQIEARMQAGMAGAFDSVSPYVKRSTFVKRSTKTDLTATVGLKDQKPSGGTAPAVLLKEHFTGGRRGNKPYEKALIAMGALPNGWRAVAGAGIGKDAYGNPRRKEVGDLLGAMHSNVQSWKGKGKNVKLVGFFVVPVGERSRLFPGIYKRIGRGVIKPMFIFVKQAAYQRIMDLQRTADQIVGTNFQPNFDAAFSEAMRTAR